MRIVLDTNVLVSALITLQGKPRQAVDMILEGKIEIAVDDRILWEYRKVLPRPKLDIAASEANAILEQIETCAVYVDADLQSVSLPDPEDEMFLQVALAAEADCIVTGNKRHFPARKCKGVRVLSPAGFIEEYLRTRSGD